MFGDEAEGGPSSFCQGEGDVEVSLSSFTTRQNKTGGGEEERTCRYEDDGFLGKRLEGGHEVVDAG